MKFFLCQNLNSICYQSINYSEITLSVPFFFPDKCFFHDLTTKLVMDTGFKADGLYQIKIPKTDKTLSSLDISEGNTSSAEKSKLHNIPSFTSVTSNSSHYEKQPLDILHARFGHASVSKMKHIPLCKQLISNSFFCETCVLAKFTRFPFNNSSIKTTHCFQLVHMDL